MAQAKSGDTVTVHYTGTLADGTVFDSSRQRDPLVFTLGAGQVIPGFEQTLMGMQTGETKTTTIPADQAYGAHEQDLVFDVDRNDLPPGMSPTVGDRYQVQQPNGQQILVMVQNVTPSHITFDANHPLAGQDLTFELQLMSID